MFNEADENFRIIMFAVAYKDLVCLFVCLFVISNAVIVQNSVNGNCYCCNVLQLLIQCDPRTVAHKKHARRLSPIQVLTWPDVE